MTEIIPLRHSDFDFPKGACADCNGTAWELPMDHNEDGPPRLIGVRCLNCGAFGMMDGGEDIVF